MHVRLIAAMVILLPHAAPAQQSVAECPDLGLESAYLQRHFCEQIAAILQQSGEDRSSWPSGDEPPEDIGTPPWRDIGMLDDAYNRDPAKTLALIERIKGAGGLENN